MRVLMDSTRMSEGFPAQGIPVQWQNFLLRHPDQDAIAPKVVAMTEAREAELLEVHNEVYQWPYVRDQGRDFWEIATPAGGDCEDLQLAVRAKLIGLGWPAGALRMLKCWRGSEPHAVLRIVSDRGCYIRCNTVPAIVPWFDLTNPILRFPYAWGVCWAGQNRWVWMNPPAAQAQAA